MISYCIEPQEQQFYVHINREWDDNFLRSRVRILCFKSF